LIGPLLAAFFVSSAWADHPAEKWELIPRNKLIEETNFVVDDRCSGTLISVELRLLITNYHCVNHKISVVEREETQEDGSVKEIKREERNDVPIAEHKYLRHEKVGTVEYLTEIVAAAERWDLALLRFKSETIPYTVFSPLLPEDHVVNRSETVWAVGNPVLLDASVTRGVVSSVTRTFEFSWTGRRKTPMLQFDASIAGGSSGGALYNDNGYLIGIPSAARYNQFLAIPIETIRAFLRDAGFGAVLGDEPEEEEETE
jgi:S1-C subfamily serine protease